MKRTSLILLALFVIQWTALSTVRAQGVYNRAKSMARRVAPSPYPTAPPRSSPYQTPPAAAPTAPAPRPPAAYAPSAAGIVPPAQPARVPGPRPTAGPGKELPDEVVRKTVEFQKKRAENGSTTAQYDLGMRYLKGDGVAFDEEKGVKWLREASKNGSNTAAKKLKEIEELKKVQADHLAITAPKTPPAKSAAETAKEVSR